MAIVEHQFRCDGAFHAHLLDFLAAGEAAHILFDQEGGDALAARVRIRARVDHQRFRRMAIGDPEFGAVEQIAALHRIRLQLHRNDIAARSRLAHRQRSDMLAADQAGEVFGLLLRVAPARDLIDAQIGMRAVGQAERSAGAAHFFDSDSVFEIAQPGTAVRFAHRHAVQAQFTQFWPQLNREPVLGIHLRSQRRNALISKTRHAVADHLRLFTKAEIKIWSGAHCKILVSEAAQIASASAKANTLHLQPENRSLSIPPINR